ncbi:MAG: hypothetical protein AB4063_08320 [Crocosphaera sp.]
MDTTIFRSLPLTSGIKSLRYQEQNSSLTLRQGLKEYYANNPNLFNIDNASTTEIGSYLRNHDISHVVFGTTTSLADEFLQDIWTFLAIDVNKKNYIFDFIKTDESKQLFQSLQFTESIKAIVTVLPLLPSLILRSLKMVKKWHWQDWESYLDLPLSEIRNEFNILVL